MKNICNYMPHWVLSGLRGRQCTKCEAHINKQHIVAIGIRQMSDNYTIYVEHTCPNCKWREITNFDRGKVSIEELCYILLDGIKRIREIEKAQQTESKTDTSKISDKEVKTLLDFMNGNNSYNEFMKFIKADKFNQTNE